VTRVAVFASGNGSTLQAILDAFRPPADAPPTADAPVTVALVVSNSPAAYALERARLSGVAAIAVDHRGRSREAFEADLAAAVDAHRIDLICLAGFMRILTPAFVNRFPGRILNTHPAMLPAFGGKGMYGEHVHRAVLDAGVAVTGCTVHVVDEITDGGPIVGQAAVPVLEGDTPETLAARVQSAERRLYPEIIRWWAAGRVELDGRRSMLHPPLPTPDPSGATSQSRETVQS
jgi:phosphoribosylglycinamide formyltransferase-1